MNISMSVMIIITTLICVLPFLWFIIIGKNNSIKKEKLFKDAIKDENLILNLKEQWNNNFIGIDESQNVLIFIKLVNQEAAVLKVELKQLKTCEINKKTREFKKEKKTETELKSVCLELTIKSNREPITLVFYDIAEDFLEDLELKRAEKWQTLIRQNSHLTLLNTRAK